MGPVFSVGERVIWLSDAQTLPTVVPVDAEIVRMAHGRFLIRTLEQATARHPAGLVDRWVEIETLRKP